MSTASAAEARAVLRRLLRAVDARLTRVAANTQWRDYVLAEFRRAGGASGGSGGGAGTESSDEAGRGLQLARDYTDLALLRSYNLGLDPEERNKKMVEATARRVGFAMPSEEKPPPRRRGGAAAEGAGGGQQQGQQQPGVREGAAAGGGDGS
ncbi:MAG: hypothetical protein J3K34DRAFT_517760 [Monoraphidium minutum]|nr:MAG: hypothetical protein J3K34DRAFT_517760 [Monoraphidium minutum]